jgi:ComF family protein
MKGLLSNIWQDFWFLFYPKICESCGQSLRQQETILCTSCLVKLPRTGFHKDKESELAQVFWGRIEIEHITSLMHFVKGSTYRKLIHKLKYQKRPDIGVFLGKELGSELHVSGLFDDVDSIVPVPLHPDRYKTRGYNQAEKIGEGLSETLKVPMDATNFYRAVATTTQTKKGRFDRWENVAEVFQVNDESKFKNKHILLIDDVITTGATIEACAQRLLKIEGVKISIASLGFASAG